MTKKIIIENCGFCPYSSVDYVPEKDFRELSLICLYEKNIDRHPDGRIIEGDGVPDWCELEDEDEP